jgi:hypothetical protein
MAYMPLKIPRSTIPIGGFGERDNTGFTRAKLLDKAFDRSIFTCRITALEYDTAKCLHSSVLSRP